MALRRSSEGTEYHAGWSARLVCFLILLLISCTPPFLQCRQFHSKLVRSGVISGEGQAPSSSRPPAEPVLKAAPQRTSSPATETRNEEERGERKRTKQEPSSKQPAFSARSDEGPPSGDRSKDCRGGGPGGSEGGPSQKRVEAETRQTEQSAQERVPPGNEDKLRRADEIARLENRRPVNEVPQVKGASVSQPVSREGGPPCGIESKHTSEQKSGNGKEEAPEEPVTDGGKESMPASADRPGVERSKKSAPADTDLQAKNNSAKAAVEPETVLQPASAQMSVHQVDTVETAKKSGPTSGSVPAEPAENPVPGSRASTVLENRDSVESGYQEQATGGSHQSSELEKPDPSRPSLKNSEGNGSFRAATKVIIARHKPTAVNDASKIVGVVRRQLSSHVASNAPAVNDASKIVGVVRRQLSSHVASSAPAVALALPAIPKPEEGPPAASAKQIRLPNGKFGPSIHSKEGVRETSGPITLYRMANGKKVSLTIRKRESDGEDGGKKRAHRGGGEVGSDTPKGLTVLLGGKTVHKRQRLSDPARAGSPARERAKENDGLGVLKSSDALIKPTKKVRIRHPTEGGGPGTPEEWDKGTPLSREERKRNRVGGSALKPRVLGSPPRLASNPSTPHSASGPDAFAEEDGGGLQTGGMSARVSSRELQQLLPSSSQAYSPLMSLASARKRDREVLNGPDRFRRGGGFEEREPPPPVHARRLLTACRLLGVLDRREAKWHASISGGWTEREIGPREHPQNGKGEPTEVGGSETKVPEANGVLPGARDDPPEARQDSLGAGEKIPDTAECPVKTGANFQGGDGEPSVDGRGAEGQPRNGVGVEVRLSGGGGVGPPLGGGWKLPEAIVRRREELFAERVKLQKRCAEMFPNLVCSLIDCTAHGVNLSTSKSPQTGGVNKYLLSCEI
jgi:hypothetical protein